MKKIISLLEKLGFIHTKETKHRIWEKEFDAQIRRQYAIMEIVDDTTRNDAWAAELLRH